MVTNQLIAGDCRMLGEEHCSYEIRCLVSHPCVMAGRRLAVGFLQILPGVFPTGVVTPMKHAAAKVCGNQGRMAGRRLAVGFRHIVPGVFPNEVYTDRVPFRVVGQSLIRRYCQRRQPTHKRDMTQVEYRSPPR